MALKARQLAPSKTGYALLLAQIYRQRSDTIAARQILEPLTRDSDQSVREEAKELLQSLSENRAGANPSRSTPATVNTSMVAEPVTSGKSRMLGGESGSVAINDGRTISASGSLPSVEDVLAKYMQALGGAAKINAVASRVVKGTFDVVGVSRGGKFETFTQSPDKIASLFEPNPAKAIRDGFNGRTGWERTAAGLRILKKNEVAAMQRTGDFYGQLNLKSLYPKITLAGTSKIGYREVYVLELQSATGAGERLYLDTQTYLPVRSNILFRLGDVSGMIEIYYDDWQEVDGIKYPFSVSASQSKTTMVFTVKEIKHNVQIDAKVFEP
jgi:FimV-like protein